MKLIWCATVVGSLALVGAAHGRSVESMGRLPKPLLSRPGSSEGAVIGRSLSSGGPYSDTTCYGGTIIDGLPDPIPGAVPPNRKYKAIRGVPGNQACWNFNSGVGSNFTDPLQAPKPGGYHHRMEGWKGIDATYNPLPYFRRTGPTAAGVDGPDADLAVDEPISTCTLAGNFSLWAGVTVSEANALCYAGGQGYGNNWNISVARTFNYPGSGSVTISLKRQVEAENDFDYLVVYVDTTGIGAAADVEVARWTGGDNGPVTIPALVPGIEMRSDAGPITIKFTAESDAGYSDEDGAWVTTCGHSIIDDVTLTGAISSVSSFESGRDGWNLVDPGSGAGGEWSDLRSLTQLPPPLTFCPCALSDSVLVFFDDTGGHNTPVSNIAYSPWIDLAAGGDAGRPGKIIQLDGYFEMPLTNYIFIQTQASWYPAVCPQTGLTYVKPFTSDGFIRYFGGEPFCSSPGTPLQYDFSSVIDQSAEQVRIAVGVLSLCQFFGNCTGVSNSTPWFDRISLCVYGSPGAPIVLLRSIDTLQDNFASDGTLNPASVARVDVNNVKGAPAPAPGTVLGDTLVVNGDGGNQEVRVVFRVRPGPFLNAGALTAWAAARWTAEPGIGAGWYSARMDTTESAGTTSSGAWMSALHEDDPKFGSGTDSDTGGDGDGGLSHDIFPDQILTPGSRIDYFVAARYLPPDPRNPGGTSWYVTPDTSGGTYLEMEVLPSSVALDTSWNCTLLVDHHQDREFLSQLLEEQGLTATLGGGGNTPEGTRFDRYDVEAPSSGQASFGRPLNTKYGASIVQTFAYKAIAWHSGGISSVNLVDEDANNLTAWLTITEVGGNRFWGSGADLTTSMAQEGETTTIQFLNNILGARLICDTIRLASCPGGSVMDSTYCLPMANVAGAHFSSALPLSGRGNGCPQLNTFDLIGVNASIPSARGQLNYQKTDGLKSFASVSNANTVDVDFKTVLDGVPVGFLRDPNGSTHNPALCNVTTPALLRTDNVFDWFRSPTSFNICKIPTAISEAGGEVPGGGIPQFRSALRSIYPNPMNPTTRIRFTNARDNGRVRIDVFDVTGRLVRTLVDASTAAGHHEIEWDGRDAGGQTVGSGLYFVKLRTADLTESRKVVVSK